MKTIIKCILIIALSVAFAFTLCIMFGMDARAADVEVDVGRSLYVNGHDDWWYMEKFEHKLNYRATTIEIGVHDSLYQSGDFDLDYAIAGHYNGDMSMQSWAVVDSNYDKMKHQCIGPCGHQSNFNGKGSNQGLSFTLEPSYSISGYRLGVEAGAYVYRNKFSEHITNVQNESGVIDVKDTSGWTVGKVVGASVTKDNFVLKYQYFVDPDHFAGKDVNSYAPAAWHGTHVVSIGWRF